MRRRTLLATFGGIGALGLASAVGDAVRSAEGEQQTTTVAMSSEDGNVFEPIGLFVEPGETVTWELGSGAHSATAYEDRIPEEAEPWDSGVLARPGETFEHTFEVEGTYDYYCLPHRSNGMIGRIVVGSPGGPAEESAPIDGVLPESDLIVQEGAVAVTALDTNQIRVTYEGEVAPGSRVTITAIQDEEPVRNANVYVKDGDGDRRLVGRTDENGQIEVTVPARGDEAGELNVKVRKHDLEGELEVETEDGDDDRSGAIRVTYEGEVAPGNRVTITATRNGEPVTGAEVYVRDGDGDRRLVGRTDENGRIEVTVPAEGDEAGELRVRVRKGELEGELEVE